MSNHTYIYSTLFATILAIVVWWIVPTEYSARTTISDEYKETDLAIGLDRLQSILNAQHFNDGTNDIEVYMKWLKTEDFAKSIAKSEDKESIKRIQDNIEYNFSQEARTLTIQFTAGDAYTAAVTLDSITQELERRVTKARQRKELALLNEYKKERLQADRDYHKALEAHAALHDSNIESSSIANIEEEKRLEQEVKLSYNHYRQVAEKCARQEALAKRSNCIFAVIKANEVPRHNTKHFIGYLIPFVLIALAFTKSRELYKARKKESSKLEFGGLFSPWAITISVWGGMMLFFALWAEELYPLTEQFYISLACWIGVFTITSFVTFNLLPHNTRPLSEGGISINKTVFGGLFILMIILCPLYIYKVYQIVSLFDTKNMFNNMRLLSVKGDGQGFLNYSYVVAQSLLLVGLWRTPKLPKWQLITIIFCCLLNAFAIMEKGMVFLVCITSMYVLFERKIIKAHTILFLGIAIIIGFFGLNIMREGETYGENESLLDFVFMYVMSPPVAFCQLMREATDQFGTNTFSTIYLFLNRFGGDYSVVDKTQEFVFVPISTNVYTIMQPFFRDFGYTGVAFFAWIYGITSGILYRYSRNGNAFAICIYTYMVEILILQFYQENIFLSMVLIVQTLFFVGLCTQNKIGFSLTNCHRYVKA